MDDERVPHLPDAEPVLRDYGYTDPTNMWAYEGSIYGISLGGASGKIARDMFSRWMVKLTGLYQLPFDINFSGTISGHEGSFYATTFGSRIGPSPTPGPTATPCRRPATTTAPGCPTSGRST